MQDKKKMKNNTYSDIIAETKEITAQPTFFVTGY